MDFTNKNELLESLNKVFLADDKEVCLSNLISDIQHQIADEKAKNNRVLKIEINPDEHSGSSIFQGEVSRGEIMSMLMSLTVLTAQTIKDHSKKIEVKLEEIIDDDITEDKILDGRSEEIKEFAEKIIAEKNKEMISKFLEECKQSFLERLEG